MFFRVPISIALAFVLALLARQTAAQSPAPALPVAMNLQTVAVGAWSEYSVRVNDGPPFRQRFALVARDATTNTIEMTAEGGTLAGGARVVLQVLLGVDLAKPDRVKKVVMQLGDNQPMEVPQGAGVTSEHFNRLDARKLRRTATIKVLAGMFKTKIHEDRTPEGQQVRLWISEGAPPFGIVKMTGGLPGALQAASVPLTMELAQSGRGARPAITRTARPFDAQALLNEVSKLGPAGGPPTLKATN